MASGMHALGAIIGAFVAVLVMCSIQIDAHPRRGCPPWYQTCNIRDGECKTNVKNDVNNCGQCQLICPSFPHSDRTCSYGNCGYRCNEPWRDCDSTKEGCETNVKTDPLNCGKCGNVCPVRIENSVATCSRGYCGINCIPGYKLCNNICIEVTTDINNCGRCGRRCPTAPNNSNALCVAGNCQFACKSGFGDCDRLPRNGCETALNTLATCGGCGNTCPAAPDHAEVSCDGRQCVTSCSAGWADCNHDMSDGCETNLSTVAACGRCGNTCPAPPYQAEVSCDGRQCVTSCKAGWADCNDDMSDGCETDLSTVAACGRCGNTCPAPPNHAEVSCDGGQCVTSCKAGWADCNDDMSDGCETDLSTVAACGRCGNTCPAAPNHAEVSCDGGQCVTSCNAGWADCNDDMSDGCETDLSTVAACGRCGNTCPAPPYQAEVSCDGRQCVTSCNAGWADCNDDMSDGCETDLSTVAACGRCGNTCPAAPNHAEVSCDGRQCVTSCKAGRADCNDDMSDGCETDLSTVAACGRCGNTCPAPPNHAEVSCDGGQCVTSCNAGWADCNDDMSDGCETDLSTVAACGRCGNTCPAAPNHAEVSCDGGQCVTSCNAGWADCNDDMSDGCETDLSTVAACGRCGNTCPAAPNHAEVSCDGRQCVTSCNAGWADCNDDMSDGCETDLSTVAACGRCGNTCPAAPNHAEVSCDGGQCVTSCKAGWADCNDDMSDGCETDLSTVAACGRCGNTCPAAPNHAEVSCDGGQCVTSCKAGWADCNDDMSDGCETDLSTVAACGRCGNTCPAAPNHAEVSCDGGQCVTSCKAGWADCNDDMSDGCETDLSTVAACGRCGNTCPAAPNHAEVSCDGGQCVTSCKAGWADCNDDMSDGCETDLSTVAACGRCGNTCPAPPNHAEVSCDGGQCVTSCNAGWADCNDDMSDGCETDLSTVAACGRCGNTCPAAPNHAEVSCDGGQCVTSCSAGWADCNHDMSDGCETDLRISESNCGTCGTVCPTPDNSVATCSAGVCESSCRRGYGDCNNGAGCETDLLNSLSNCGVCSNICPVPPHTFAPATCSAGICGYSRCKPGFLDCDRIPGNGCEARPTNLSSCGGCGRVCAPANVDEANCRDLVCSYNFCSRGWADCDSVRRNGCETDLRTVENCGSCGNACTGICSGNVPNKCMRSRNVWSCLCLN